MVIFSQYGARPRPQPRRPQHQDPPILAGQGRPLCLRVTGGQRHDRTQARAWAVVWTGAPLSCLIADQAYDVDALRAWLARQGIEAVIPVQTRRTNP